MSRPTGSTPAPTPDSGEKPSSKRGRKGKRKRGSLFKRRFTNPGALPGRFAGPAKPDSAQIRVLTYEGRQWTQEENISITDLPPRADHRLLWFDVRGVQDHAAVRAIGAHLELHPLAIADVVNIGQRPKLE